MQAVLFFVKYIFFMRLNKDIEKLPFHFYSMLQEPSKIKIKTSYKNLDFSR